jgi:hypothetical protein
LHEIGHLGLHTPLVLCANAAQPVKFHGNYPRGVCNKGE